MVKFTEFTLILKPSTIGGIGVFTTHDIPAGTQVFTEKFAPRKMNVKDIPQDFIKYCIFLNKEECLCPKRFDHMEIGWYLNHSHEANIKKIAENYTVAVRDIKAGEEILIDYNQLNEPEDLKEAYYRPKNS